MFPQGCHVCSFSNFLKFCSSVATDLECLVNTGNSSWRIWCTVRVLIFFIFKILSVLMINISMRDIHEINSLYFRHTLGHYEDSKVKSLK